MQNIKHILLFTMLAVFAASCGSEQEGSSTDGELKTKEWKVDEVPNTRLESDSIHVCDPDGIIGSVYCDSINSVLSSIRDKADVFIVALEGVEGVGDDFAQLLGRKWGIGAKNVSNGVLVLATMNPHYIRIHTGYGVEATMPDVICSTIIHEKVAPLFKQDKYKEGFLVCAKEIKEVVEADSVELAAMVNNAGNGSSDDSNWFTTLLLCLIPAPVLVWFYRWRAKVKREKPRKCPKCGKDMHRLSEEEEDEFLSAEQQAEEAQLSVDYDVWRCDDCNETIIENYKGERGSHFVQCPKCGTKLSEFVGKEVVKEPTIQSVGQERHDYVCSHCKHKHSVFRELEKLEDPAAAVAGAVIGSTLGGGRGGGGSIGGSFGGGSFGGGGASGSW